MAGTSPRDCVLTIPSQPESNLIIASFSNGRITPEETRSVEFEVYQNKKTDDGLPRKRTRQILVAKTKRLQYAGYNFGPEASQTGNLCRFHVGIFHKRKRKMKLFETNLFQCKPVLENMLKESEQQELTISEKKNLLTSTFGSKKKKQAMESRLRYDVKGTQSTAATEEAIAQTEISETQRGTKVTKSKMTEEATDTIPPQNKDAASEKDVYSLNDIVTNEELETITVDANILIEATPEQIDSWKKEATYAGYLLHYLPRLTSPNCNNKPQKAKLLVFYNFLIQVLRLRYQELRRKDPMPGIPVPIKQKLIDLFTVTSKNENGTVIRSMPPRLKDKVVAYAFVVVMFLENFTVDLSLVQADFRMSVNRIMSICFALGCHVSTRKTEISSSAKVAELKLPLFVPGSKFIKGRKK